MTTKIYRVAFPHPSVDPDDRCCLCEIGSQTTRNRLLDQLFQEYPDWVEDLKRATFFKASDLSRWDVKGDSTQKVYNWIKLQGKKAELEKDDPIAKSFPGGPQDLSLDKVDIVAVTPEIREAMLGDVGGLGCIKARKQTSKEIRQGPAPSDCVKSPNAIQEMLDGSHGPRYGRPSHRFGPPTALFSEPLALLKYELDHPELFMPDVSALDAVFKLVTISAGVFVNKDARERDLRPILTELLPGDVNWQMTIQEETAKPGGVWFEGDFPCLIFELKNEQGLGGDPFLQSSLSYGKIITQTSYNKYLEQSNLPAVLLAIAGNRLVVSTAVYTNEIYVDELLSIPLRLGFHGPDNILRVARIFVAINNAIMRLRELYKSIPGLPSPSPRTMALWPKPTADPPQLTENLPKLGFFAKANRFDGTELSYIDEDNERHGMYLARMQINQAEESTQEVFVKFAAKYHEDAHRLLARQDPPLAPALYFCGRVIGDVYMAVMEYIPRSKGRPIHQYSSDPFWPQNLPEIVDNGVSKALWLLHGQNLVFGDLREPNVLYLPDSDGGRILLVDFDGVGPGGEARYSACLNRGAGYCDGVDRGQVMEQDHDRKNFKALLERLQRVQLALTKPVP